MMFDVRKISEDHSFMIKGVSYVGRPKSNTAMFVTKKVEHLVTMLQSVNECLVFAEDGIEVSESLMTTHCFVFSDSPQAEYAKFTESLYKDEEKNNSQYEYVNKGNGIFISTTASIGHNSVIEPNVVIGPGVIIGDNARLCSGAVIKNAIIGDNVIINDNATIGANGFTMAVDEQGNKIRIFSLGKVVIGNNVEVGAHDNISRGSGGDTVLEDYVKIDAHVHIGHDVHLHKNVEITAGVVVGGFVEAMENCYIGINSVIRNRIVLGKGSFIGMGATVTKSVDDDITVVGNPAKPFERK